MEKKTLRKAAAVIRRLIEAAKELAELEKRNRQQRKEVKGNNNE